VSIGSNAPALPQDATGSTRGAFLILASPPLTAAMLCVLVLRRQLAFKTRPMPDHGHR
jgi:hypothetical protein